MKSTKRHGMTIRHGDIRRGLSVLFAALLVFVFATPVCVTMACSISGMAPTVADASHMGGMVHTGIAGAAEQPATTDHSNHSSIADCMRGFTSHSGLIGTDGLTLAAILIAIALMGLASATSPLAAVGTSMWSTPLRAPSPPPPLAPLGVRLSV